MDVTDQFRNEQEMVMRAVMLTVERAQMRVDNQDGHFQKAQCEQLNYAFVNNIIKNVCNVIPNQKNIKFITL
jgi:hypothetical protein